MSTLRNRRQADAKTGLSQLQNPTHLRIVLSGIVLLIGYGGVYAPLSASIDESHRKLAAEQKRLEVVRDIEVLREQHKLFEHLLPDKADMNEWIEYVLNGVRRFPLKLVTLAPDAERDLGPYKVVVLRIELQGRITDLNDFMLWLETNRRLIRVDMVSLQPPQQAEGTLNMQLTVLGVMG